MAKVFGIHEIELLPGVTAEAIVAQLVKTLFSAIIRWLREQNH